MTGVQTCALPILGVRYLRRIGFTPDEATDLVCASTEKALRGFDNFKQDKVFKDWFMRIVKNTATDYIRKKKTEAVTTSLNAGVTLHGYDKSWVEHETYYSDYLLYDPYQKSDDEMALNNALAFLPRGQREVLEMRMAGLTWEEIATDLGRNISTVKTSGMRAIRRMRQVMTGEEK